MCLQPTKIPKSNEDAKLFDQPKKSMNLDHNKRESYLQSLVTKLNDLKIEIVGSLPSFRSILRDAEMSTLQESAHHSIAPGKPK